MDPQPRKGHLPWMDVDDVRRQIQTPDRLGQVLAPHLSLRETHTWPDKIFIVLDKHRTSPSTSSYHDVAFLPQNVSSQTYCRCTHDSSNSLLLKRDTPQFRRSRERRLTGKLGHCLGHCKHEAMKAHIAQLQATPSKAEIEHDVRARKPKRQDNICTRCGLDHGATWPAMQ